ncbi:MAG: hypothetical protein ABS62_11885 [Microbacterium sp. SCN 70-200]|uniref:DUF3817 domain-containing protein n=1 Tax=unclassified Microbacterium TaxID=2609290 RepID=UPI00086F025B|nr:MULTISPECIES: DUF3817 domain-containing protein [unclassified Microbacterium]MBN9215752.1 DUF3817 domain-containing protein [Microbacterium sp.]ODT39962.1 MAG: hypothetical protein ABS62_11885 [Microbacterium sp. SCN 70-200]OJV81987.1 MAG: hypothetical protein BGO46_08475 [Microbacterium sp. 70-16]
MPQPKLATFPAIRGALRFYQIASVITGCMLLLLCAEMILKYAFGLELFLGGSGGLLWFAHVDAFGESTGDGTNLSLGILIAHGWFYVVYLFACFRVWSLMRWGFLRFVTLALGGIVPLLSFFMEARVAREVRAYLADREATELHSRAEHSSLTQQIPTENQR